MTVAVETIDREEIKGLISNAEHIAMSSAERESLDACVFISQYVYVGKVDGKVACMWGLVSPTLLSDQAYLWLYSSPLVEQHKFLFIRHSQRWIEEALREYSVIVGHVTRGNTKAVQWIKWLGGEFIDGDEYRHHFRIRSRNNG